MRALVVVTVMGCMTPVIPFGAGKTATESQHQVMTELTSPTPTRRS